MNQQRAIEALEELLPQIKQEGKPEGVLLKYASDHNLSPAQLEKMAHVFNTAKSLTYFDKAPNRGGSFALVNPQDLVQEYTRYEAPTALSKAASTGSPEGSLKFPGISMLEPMGELEKAAGEKVSEKTPKQLAHEAKQAAAQISKEIHYTEQALDFFREEIKKSAKEIQLTLRRPAEDVDRETYVGDVMFTFGKEAGELVLTQTLGPVWAPVDDKAVEKRAFDGNLRSHPGRLKLLDLAAGVWENMHLHKVASESLGELMEKKSGKGKGRTPAEELARIDEEINIGLPQAKARRKAMEAEAMRGMEAPEPVVPEDTYSELSDVDLAALTNLIGKAKLPSVNPGAPYKEMTRLLDGFAPSYNKDQEDVDNARGEVSRAVTLARLMQSDPIISNADPEMVNDIYNDLQEINPEYVRNPMRLRMLLREAVQYGMVPSHTIKELADIRKTMAGARGTEEGLTGRSDQYKLGKRPADARRTQGDS